MRGFETYHPAVLFTYYLLAVAFSMLSMHPVVILASFWGAILFFAAEKGVVQAGKELGLFFLLFLLLSVTNPLFVHSGETVLFYMNGNAITLEALLYGAAASLMILSVLIWCRCYSSILTTDKFLYLFGKAVPKPALLLSMAFRFIPLFKKQMIKISGVQKTMGMYASDSIPDKIRGGVRVFDSLVSWAMENAIDTADAMKARGYGIRGRTNFSLFRFRNKDKILFGIILAAGGVLGFLFVTGEFDFHYYPEADRISFSAVRLLEYSLMTGFMSIPGIIEIMEKLSWKCLKLKI